jgi:predicted ABC-type ATPase
MRMFAGPNGSGKTTVKNQLPPDLFGVYVNPDDIEKAIRDEGFLRLDPYGLSFTSLELQEYFASSELLKASGLNDSASVIDCRENKVSFRNLAINSYFASVLSDALRRKLLATSISFSFETVMSSPDKVELLRDARSRGFRTYLYYVATEDPAINIERVKNRVADGGHDVPEEKIVARYYRSLGLLREAIRHTNRAYLFDTSEKESWYVAEITEGVEIDLKSEEMPAWFKTSVWDKY